MTGLKQEELNSALWASADEMRKHNVSGRIQRLSFRPCLLQESFRQYSL